MIEIEDARPDEDRRRFLEARQAVIGATDAAAILGISPWSTPLKVWHDKTDPIEEGAGQPSLPMWLGLRLEDVVAELFTARTGLKTRADNRQHIHPTDSWLGCHLDYRVLGRPNEIVECKTQSFRAGWGEDGSDEVPVYYWTQAQHEMLVTGADVVHFAVLFNFQEFRVLPVKRDENFLLTWQRAAREFWENHVLARVPPPLEGDSFSRDVVRRRWPEYDDVLKVVPPERELVILQLRDETRKLKEQEKQVEALKHRVEDLIGTSAGVEGSWGRITWKSIKDRAEIAWDKVADGYAAVIGDILEHVNPGDDDEAVRSLAQAQRALEALPSLYTTIKDGYRRIDVRFKKE